MADCMVDGVNSDRFGGTEYTPKNGENTGTTIKYKNCIFNLNDKDGVVDVNDIDTSNINIKDKKAQKLLDQIYQFLKNHTGNSWNLDLKSELNKLVTNFNLVNRVVENPETPLEANSANSKEKVETKEISDGCTVKTYYKGNLKTKEETIKNGVVANSVTYEYNAKGILTKKTTHSTAEYRRETTERTETIEYYEDGVHPKTKSSVNISINNSDNSKDVAENNILYRRNGHRESYNSKLERFNAENNLHYFIQKEVKYDENGWKTEQYAEENSIEDNSHSKMKIYYSPLGATNNSQTTLRIEKIEADDITNNKTYYYNKSAHMELGENIKRLGAIHQFYSINNETPTLLYTVDWRDSD